MTHTEHTAGKVMTLKPCPFCGSEDVRVTAFGERSTCNACHSFGPFVAKTEDDAIAAWNRRPDTELREALEKLANEVSGMKAFEIELRPVMSNTNWNVLMLREEEARTALAKTGTGEKT